MMPSRRDTPLSRFDIAALMFIDDYLITPFAYFMPPYVYFSPYLAALMLTLPPYASRLPLLPPPCRAAVERARHAIDDTDAHSRYDAVISMLPPRHAALRCHYAATLLAYAAADAAD